MKIIYTDLETRWTVAHEPFSNPHYDLPMTVWTLTDPHTGERHTRLPSGSNPDPDIATWVRHIPRHEDPEVDMDLKTTEFLHLTYPELAAGAELPHGPLPRIKLDFARGFGLWHIALPEPDVVARRRGKICKGGWAIWYLFGEDEKGEYLDFYSAHRMTNDSHVRLYENGDPVSLPELKSFRIGSHDPEVDARLKAEHLAENRRVQALLQAKGFGLTGDEPGGVQIQRYQLLRDEEQ
jgi:hypothetical protein